MLRREFVRDSCSVRLWVRRASVVAVDMPVVVASKGGWRSSSRGLRRERRVEGGSSRFETGSEGVSDIVDAEKLSSSRAEGGWMSSVGEGGSDMRSKCVPCESVSSEGVSSPRRSSPSEEEWSVSWSPSSLSSCNRSASCCIMSRLRIRSDCVSCFRVCTLMFCASCSSRKSSDRAYSRFYPWHCQKCAVLTGSEGLQCRLSLFPGLKPVIWILPLRRV